MYPVVDFRLFFNNIAEKYSVTSVHMTGHTIEVPMPRIASENILMRATGRWVVIVLGTAFTSAYIPLKFF
jgi:hypothetical protein